MSLVDGRLTLSLSTPQGVLVDRQGIASLRAEDSSGSFGIRPGHIDFLTALIPCVVHWRLSAQLTGPLSDPLPGHLPPHGDRYCVVHGGVLTVSAGSLINIACRDAVLADSLENLQVTIAQLQAERLDAARRANVEVTRLHAQALRHLVRGLQAPPQFVSPAQERST